MNWNYPTNIWFGVDRAKQIQEACNQLNVKNPLIVTDPGLLKTPIIDQINSDLQIKQLFILKSRVTQLVPTLQTVLKFF